MASASNGPTPRADGRNLLGLDSRLNLDSYDAGGSYYRSYKLPNAIEYWSANLRTLRERSMIAFMNQITDKPEWTRKITDADIIAKWKAEATEQAKKVKPEEALTERMVDYCLGELADYATQFQKHHFIPAIRADATVFKSDTIVPSDLKQSLRDAVAPLEDIPDKFKDWHPNSGEKVLDLVHPSLFPLLYGRSRILKEGIVTLQDCERFTGKGEVMPVPHQDHLRIGSYHQYTRPHYGPRNHKFYSDKFQWLPCEVAFEGDNDVKITSYINNLHPRRNEKLYKVIEDVIARTIPMWDCTLASIDKYKPTRIHVSPPYYTDPGERPRGEDEGEEDDTWELDYEWEHANRMIIMPEPLAYNPDGNSGYEYPALRPETSRTENDSNQPPQKEGLRQIFAFQGLQIIVKLANIHLDPSKPSYEGGSWHIEGQLNEHICASALYYYDSSNITDSHLAFREKTNSEDMYDMYEQGEYEHLEVLFGIEQDGAAIQDLGRVLTREGRLLTFPNVLQHRVSPFELADPTQPGHRKILALFLVDPYLRIPSTANVPPQQKDWWRETVQTADRVGELPAELVDRIVDEVEDFPIGLDEAKSLRLELIEERKMFVQEVDDQYNEDGFSFCEH